MTMKALKLIQELIELKNAPGRHDQKSHGHAGEGYTVISSDKEGDVVELDSYKGLEKFRKNSDKRDVISVAYNLSTHKLYATNKSGHVFIAESLYGQDNKAKASFMDGSVRFSASNKNDKKFYMYFYTMYAGAGWDYDKSMKNIYRTFDALKARGFPSDFPVEIRSRGVEGVPRLVTTTLKMVEFSIDNAI